MAYPYGMGISNSNVPSSATGWLHPQKPVSPDEIPHGLKMPIPQDFLTQRNTLFRLLLFYCGSAMTALYEGWLDDIQAKRVTLESQVKLHKKGRSEVIEAVTAVWPPTGRDGRFWYDNLVVLEMNGFAEVSLQAKLCMKLSRNIINLEAAILLPEATGIPTRPMPSIPTSVFGKSGTFGGATEALSLGGPYRHQEGWLQALEAIGSIPHKIGLTTLVSSGISIGQNLLFEAKDSRIDYILPVKWLELENAFAWAWLKEKELELMDSGGYSLAVGDRAVPDNNGKAIQSDAALDLYDAGFTRVLGRAKYIDGVIVPLFNYGTDTIAYRNQLIAVVLAAAYGDRKASEMFADETADAASAAIIAVGIYGGRAARTIKEVASHAAAKLSEASGLTAWGAKTKKDIETDVNDLMKDVDKKISEWVRTGIVASLLAAVVYANWKSG